MGEVLPDGSIQPYSTICPKCGKEVWCNIQGNVFNHECQREEKTCKGRIECPT